MPHILVSHVDSLADDYSRILLQLVNGYSPLQMKSVYAINGGGEQTQYILGISAAHYLIRDCGMELFSTALRRKSQYKDIKFRVVEDKFLEARPVQLGGWSGCKLNLDEILKTTSYSIRSMLESGDELKNQIVASIASMQLEIKKTELALDKSQEEISGTNVQVKVGMFRTEPLPAEQQPVVSGDCGEAQTSGDFESHRLG